MKYTTYYLSSKNIKSYVKSDGLHYGGTPATIFKNLNWARTNIRWNKFGYNKEWHKFKIISKNEI